MSRLESLVLLGTDPRVLAIGQRALEHNRPLLGIWSLDHNQALRACLPLGCSAYPEPEELLLQADRVVYSEVPASWPAEAGRLAVESLVLLGNRVVGTLEPEWVNWLTGLGFEVSRDG